MGSLFHRVSLCSLLQVCGKAAGCNSYGHLFFKSTFVNPEHSEEEEENTVKADQAFWYVLLLEYRQSYL